MTTLHLRTEKIRSVGDGPKDRVGLHFGASFSMDPLTNPAVKEKDIVFDLKMTGYAFGPSDQIFIEVWFSLVAGPYTRVIFDEHGPGPVITGLQWVRGKVWAVEEDRSAYLCFHASPTRALTPVNIAFPAVTMFGEDRGMPPSYTYPYGMRQSDSRYLVTYRIGTSTGRFYRQKRGEGSLVRSISDPGLGSNPIGTSLNPETRVGVETQLDDWEDLGPSVSSSGSNP